MTIVCPEAAINATLLTLAWAGSLLAGIPIMDRISISVGSLGTGIVGGLLLASVVPLRGISASRRIVFLRDLNRICHEILVPMTRDLRPIDIVVLVVLSGVSEELFFRGVLQALVGLTAASLLFGVLHWLGPACAAWATGMGALLGLVYTTTGNLVVPTTMHIVHNLLALPYLRYCHIERA